jgi:hypothetical protein
MADTKRITIFPDFSFVRLRLPFLSQNSSKIRPPSYLEDWFLVVSKILISIQRSERFEQALLVVGLHRYVCLRRIPYKRPPSRFHREHYRHVVEHCISVTTSYRNLYTPNLSYSPNSITRVTQRCAAHRLQL